MTVLREVNFVYFPRTVIFTSNLFYVNGSIFKIYLGILLKCSLLVRVKLSWKQRERAEKQREGKREGGKEGRKEGGKEGGREGKDAVA